MKSFSLLAAVLALGFTLATADAEAAKRLGSGKSTGMQRQATTPDKSPTSSPAAASTAAKAPAAAAAPQKRSWMGPLAGLAAGLGLAALASHLGFGEELASMMMIGLLVLAVVVAIGFFMRRRAAAQQAATGGGMQYAAAGAGNAPANQRAYEVAMPPSGSAGAHETVAGSQSDHAVGHIPADFDAAAFERNAKVSFIRLQAANDSGNIEDIRTFTTPEMFAEISLTISERGGAVQETDVVQLEARVTDVAEEANRYIVSVRFSGQIREDGQATEAIDEVWHMVKPRDGSSGWVLAGIQQVM